MRFNSGHLTVIGLAAVAIAVTACSGPVPNPAASQGSAPSTASPSTDVESDGSVVLAFSGQRPTVTVSAGLAALRRQVSLPDPTVSGMPDAVVVDHHPGQDNGLFIRYPSGIFLAIEPGDWSPDRALAESKPANQRHPDGSPYLTIELIGGRQTLVGTRGEIVQTPPGRRRDAQDVLNWSQDGYHYTMRPYGPNPASLDVMRRVAASVR